MQVQEIMTPKVISVMPTTPVYEVASLIFDHNLTGMPVVDNENQVVGIITEYDLMSRSEHIHLPTYVNLLKELAEGSPTRELTGAIEKIQHLKAQDLMTTPVVSVSPDTPVEKAAEIFSEQHINPLPVIEEGKLVGIISRADIVKLFKKVTS